MDKEMIALDASHTWELVPLRYDKKAIGGKWVYKIKYYDNGSISRYKERLVAKRSAQTYDINYEETFSLFARMATVIVVIVVAAVKG